MQQKLTAALIVFALALVGAACAGNADHTSANANMAASEGVRTAADGSEIRTEMDGGVKTETRTFKDPNSRIEKVVVTTRDGRRTARVYYRDNTVRELPGNAVESALIETADKLEDAGGKVVDVSKDIGSEVGDKAEDVGDKAADVGSEVGDKAEDVKDQTVSGAKKVGSEAADKAEDIGDKAASGAKQAGKATVKGAKKAGSAIKDAVTP